MVSSQVLRRAEIRITQRIDTSCYHVLWNESLPEYLGEVTKVYGTSDSINRSCVKGFFDHRKGGGVEG
jgi:hypothetical protein